MLSKICLTLSVTVLLVSCSPKIKSNFTKRYPSLSQSEKIKIYKPETYAKRDNSHDELIGSVSVYDGGFTTNCSYDKMLQIIKDSARINGGNIIGLKKHRKPSLFGSSCHQFEGDILRQHSKQNNSLSINSKTDTIQDNTFDNLKEEITHPFLFSFNVGPSFAIGKKDNSTEFTRAIHDILKVGTQFSFNGLYKINNSEAIGLKYSYTYRGGNVNDVLIEFNDPNKPTEFGVFNIETQVNYYALKFYDEYPFGNKKNRFTLDGSVGYFTYKEVSGIETIFTVTSGNLGFDFYTGYERVINEQFAIGLNAGIFTGSISKLTVSDGQTTEKINLDRENRMNLSSVNIGLNLSYRL